MVLRKSCAQPIKKIKPPLFRIMTILLRNSLREIFVATRTCENSSLQQRYVWGKARNNCYYFCKKKGMGFWGGDSHVTHQKSRFRCAALSKIRNHLKRKLAALMKAKGSLTLDFQSCMNNIHIYDKNWNKRATLLALSIRFQQALGRNW